MATVTEPTGVEDAAMDCRSTSDAGIDSVTLLPPESTSTMPPTRLFTPGTTSIITTGAVPTSLSGSAPTTAATSVHSIASAVAPSLTTANSAAAAWASMATGPRTAYTTNASCGSGAAPTRNRSRMSGMSSAEGAPVSALRRTRACTACHGGLVPSPPVAAGPTVHRLSRPAGCTSTCCHVFTVLGSARGMVARHSTSPFADTNSSWCGHTLRFRSLTSRWMLGVAWGAKEGARHRHPGSITGDKSTRCGVTTVPLDAVSSALCPNSDKGITAFSRWKSIGKAPHSVERRTQAHAVSAPY